ncbi:hypothetical protein ILUMI_20665 [Ignelater luminosus]|uniref:ATP synthase mitochondrial F1 complex assembly factor 1 n=1 Tax=Ignelater luminosus TaxID=2038154 RepID=A0A8K0CDQ6_IGNLU|nr:hypothetical protein ILUMI_20665 [Ignelater luminosus]
MEIVSKLFRRNTFKTIYTLRRTIMTSLELRNKAEKAAEELKGNPYYEKYSRKIAALQQTSPEEFLSRVEARKEENAKPKFGADASRQYSSLLEPKKRLTSNTKVGDESLNKIMKLELIQDKDVNEIKRIWEEYHKTKDVIAATIPIEIYNEINSKATNYPTFLFAIPRTQGYEFIVCQFYRNTVHFTPLLNYQVHKENAPECLTIVHYTEFKDNKGIVLMRGEFDKNVLNVQEAQCLANQLQLYYGQNDPQKIALLEQFTKRPDEFKHMDLIKQIETLSLVTK